VEGEILLQDLMSQLGKGHILKVQSRMISALLLERVMRLLLKGKLRVSHFLLMSYLKYFVI